MFSRNRQSQGLGLPTATGGPPSSRTFFAAKSNDGSARSIHLQNPIVQQWNRSSRERKITYIAMVTCFLSMVFGWRWLMYYNAYLRVDCNSTDCFIKFASPGRYKKINLEIPRSQLGASAAVKVSPTGEIKEDKVNLNEEWRNIQKTSSGKKKKNTAINSYRGPDANGNFLTYAIIFKDKSGFVNQKNTQDDEVKAEKLSDLESNEKDLSALVGTFGDRLENGDIRVPMRQFGVTQTHRRVRNMTSKLDSYIAKRRQKLSIRESAPANWQAILMVVLGLVGFLLSILIGLFWDENEEHHKKKEGGPGTRRRPEGKRDENPYGRQTPSRYEVSTTPIATRARTSATTTRRR
eukprot:scaffold425_cov175-Amphora_coffeaeformis.AAC.51